MKFPAGTRTRILLDPVTLDFDPTGSTIELQVDGTWYPCTWLGTATASGAKWTQQARTVAYFSGTAQPTTTVLTTGRHPTRTRVTLSGDVIVADSSPVDIV